MQAIKLAILLGVSNVLSYYDFTSCRARVAQSVGYLTRKSEVLGSIPSLATYLLLIQEGQLSATGESMCTTYLLTT